MPNLVSPGVVVNHIQASPHVWVDETSECGFVLALASTLQVGLLNKRVQAVIRRATHVVCAVQRDRKSVVICSTYLGKCGHHILFDLSQPRAALL